VHLLDLSTRYATRIWFVTLRGIANLLYGTIAWSHPELGIDTLSDAFGVWLVVINTFEVLPFLTGRTRRLRWQTIITDVFGILIGVLTVTRSAMNIELAAFLLGVALILRAALELSILADRPLRVRQRRVLVASILVSTMIGTFLISGPFGDRFAFERLLGVYLMVIGGFHIIKAWRIWDEIQDPPA
jgi:uncharacterized membrane protein HdeD (DUF308 family)